MVVMLDNAGGMVLNWFTGDHWALKNDFEGFKMLGHGGDKTLKSSFVY